MTTFVDSSALYALLDRNDENHLRAAAEFERLEHADLVTHNYVLVEASALAQRRFGPPAVRTLLEDLASVLRVIWVDEDIHRVAVSVLLAASRRGISLVDCVSFEVMRRARIERAFAFDRDFALQGFRTVP